MSLDAQEGSDDRGKRADEAVQAVLGQWLIVRAIELADSGYFASARDVLAVIRREAPALAYVLDNELMLCINERCRRARRSPRAMMRARSRASAKTRRL